LKYERVHTDGGYKGKCTTYMPVSPSCNVVTNINIQNNRTDLIIVDREGSHEIQMLIVD